MHMNDKKHADSFFYTVVSGVFWLSAMCGNCHYPHHNGVKPFLREHLHTSFLIFTRYSGNNPTDPTTTYEKYEIRY